MGETYALIPAAGSGARFRNANGRGAHSLSQTSEDSNSEKPVNKLLMPLAGKPVLAHTLLAFEECEEIQGIILVGSSESMADYRRVAEDAGILKTIRYVEGGSTRQSSVSKGLAALPAAADLVAIHDAARPLVTPEIIARTVKAARESGAALAGLPVVDTIKRVDESGFILDTLPRAELVAAQTPQTFRVTFIRNAHIRAAQADHDATDDATLAENMGLPVVVVPGDRRNLKITTPEDLAMAESLLGEGRRVASLLHPPAVIENETWEDEHQEEESPDAEPLDPADAEPSPAVSDTASTLYTSRSTSPASSPPQLAPFRVGFGYDIHRLAEGRKLMLGGVAIPHSKGLDGHSDADVLLHALMDALLGAAGLPDIGHLFPNTEERWRGAPSRVMLREVAAQLNESGWRPSNVDLTLIAERPKIAPHLSTMRAVIAQDLGLEMGSVGIKATTNEQVDAVGRDEAMAAHAVALLVPDDTAGTSE